MSKGKKKDHKAQVIFKGIRYIGIEHEGKVTFSRDGAPAGNARWRDDQLLESSALLPDEVILQMGKEIKAAIAADYFD
jgi:hypothetical protein